MVVWNIKSSNISFITHCYISNILSRSDTISSMLEAYSLNKSFMNSNNFTYIWVKWFLQYNAIVCRIAAWLQRNVWDEKNLLVELGNKHHNTSNFGYILTRATFIFLYHLWLWLCELFLAFIFSFRLQTCQHEIYFCSHTWDVSSINMYIIRLPTPYIHIDIFISYICTKQAYV